MCILVPVTDPTWTTRPSGLRTLTGLMEMLMTVQRIELLTKLVRAKRQLEAERLSRGV